MVPMYCGLTIVGAPRSWTRRLARLDARIAATMAACTTFVYWALCVSAVGALWQAVFGADTPPAELVRLVEERAAEGAALHAPSSDASWYPWLNVLQQETRFRLFAGFWLDLPAEDARVVSADLASGLCPGGASSCRTADGRWHVTAPVGTGEERLAVTFAAAATQRSVSPWLLATALLMLLPAAAAAGLVTIAVTAVVTRPLRRRVRTILAAIDDWSRDGLHARILDDSSDELGEVGRRLDTMAASLEAARRRERARAAEEERSRLLRVLHDDVKQDLFAASLHLSTFDSDDSSLVKTKAAIQRARLALDQLLSERVVEAAITRPLADLVAELAAAWGRVVAVEGTPSTATSGNPILRAFVREAMVNAFRHAAPNSVTVRYGDDGDALWAEVEDEGQSSWNPARPTTRKGGLAYVRLLAEAAGGVVSLTSSPRGSRARVVLPRGSIR